MNPQIFREYDIRGIADEDMTDEDVLRIGKGVGTFLKQRGCSRLSVGRDCRLSSERYAQKVIDGLRATGCEVTEIGTCPTPVFYFSIQHLKLDGGVMVTASHNPKEYNGFKLCQGLDSVHGQDIQTIRQIIESQAFAQGSGNLASDNVVPGRRGDCLESC